MSDETFEGMHPLTEALRDLDEAAVKRLVEREVEAGTPVMEVVGHLNGGMVAVGRLFAEDEYFISQLIYSAEIFRGAMARLEPLLAGSDPSDGGGTVIIGTVKGDIHDIGKNIVVTLLRGAGFDVVDAGVNVPAERFVEIARETGARVVGLSALLNFTYPEMKKVVDTFVEAGLRDEVHIIVGGSPVNEQVREYAGADSYAEDAVSGVDVCREIYG
ncbi:MAG: cobalamin B12-binding domain-containing protein [Thermoleophilia bacterium]